MRSIRGYGRWRAVNPVHLLRGSAFAIGLGALAGLAALLQGQRTQILADAEHRVAKAARVLEHHAAHTIETTDAYLRTVSTLVGSQAQDLSAKALHTSLHGHFVGSRALSNVVVIDRNGTSVAEAVAFPARPLDVRDRDYFQALRDNPGDTLAVGRPIVGVLTGRLVLPIARRVVGPDGRFAGIVQAVLDAAVFQSFYDAIDDGPGALLNLWRADGTLLVRSPSAPDLVGRNYAASDNYRHHVAIGDTKPFWSRGVTDGAERVIALGFLEGHPVHVGAALSKAEILAPWRRSAVTQGLLGAGLTAVLVAALLLLAREVAQRRIVAARILTSERRFRLMAENSNDIIVLGDLDMRVLYASPAMRTMMGYAPEEIVGRTASDFVHPDDAALLGQTSADLLGQALDPPDDRQGRIVSRMRFHHKDGHHVWIEGAIRLARDERSGEPVGYVVALRDITERRAAEERLRNMALCDALTGLPNRTLFRDRLDQAIAHAARTGGHFAVLACDLDRFKAVNDSLGHPAGDALLRVVADRMRAVLRPYDTVARLGGDEFAIVLAPLDDPYAASCHAERLIAAVSAPVTLDGQVVEVGVSIGFTVASGQDAGADELFKRADIALYEAKAGGRNTHREFCPAAGARIATRGQLGLDMKEAIRRGEFRLVYQPVVEAGTGTVVSFEALMRWRHPSRGEISPAEFIPVAEETGLIVPLGIWALQEACRAAMDWPSPIRVAVNVSAVQLRREGLEAAILGALAASGLPASRLKLEVTESVLMQDSDAILASLHRLRGLGVRVALDDFGTGYSSLGYLRRFPFDKIKIDRSFIRDIAHPDAAAIVRAVVGIGERLGMGIVAEGVETQEQLDLVRREGCAQVQGFLFSRPLPPDEARAYALAHGGGSALAPPLAA